MRAQSDFSKALEGSWPTERLELANGRVLHGLVEEESASHLQFLEVRRRPGLPPSLVGRYLARSEIVRLEQLGEDERVALQKRLDAIRNRAAIETGRAQSVEIESIDRDGVQFWTYSGPWFRLEAALEPWEVRTVVLRLEQMFRGFDQVLGGDGGHSAAGEPLPRAVSVLVFGDHRQYASFLRREGLPIRNPAFFDPRRMRVVVSSDLNRLYAAALAVEKEHARRLRELFPQDPALLKEALARRDQELKAGGVSEAQRNQVSSLSAHRWLAEERSLIRQMRLVNERYGDELHEEREELQRRLFHEAFHAYAQTNIAQSDSARMPLWLAEGLAQVFESARFDTEDLLHIDSPDAERLARLEEDLASDNPLRLRDLLVADQTSFLVPHDASGRTSERHYLYAWGVAYFLAFEHPEFSSQRLREYGSLGEQSATRAFEQLVEMPLDTFERNWREKMRKMVSSQ